MDKCHHVILAEKADAYYMDPGSSVGYRRPMPVHYCVKCNVSFDVEFKLREDKPVEYERPLTPEEAHQVVHEMLTNPKPWFRFKPLKRKKGGKR